MKSIFTKLTTLLLAGAVVLVGCSDFSADLREVNDRLENLQDAAATKTEVAALKSTVETLVADLNTQYALKTEVAEVSEAVKNVKTAYEAAVADLQGALANKADKAAVETAIAGVQTALETAAAQFQTALESLAKEDTAIKTSVEELQGDVTELTAALESAAEAFETELANVVLQVEALDADLASFETTLEGYAAEVEAALVAIAADIEAVAADLEAGFAAVDTKVAELKAADEVLAETLATEVEELEGLVAAVNTLLAEKVADLEASDDDILEALEALEADYNDFADAVADDFDGVYAELDDIWDEVDAIWSEISGLISDLNVDFAALEERLVDLEDAFAALEVRVDSLEAELRSIVSVPQTIVNGQNAVEFLSLTYVPMTESDELVESGAAKTIALPAYAYFRFNPSSFALANAEYSIVSEEVAVITKAAADEAVVIESIAEEDGKVKVELTRGATGNMFALAATLKSNGAVVYSDYVYAYDNALSAKDIVISGKNVVETFEAAKVAEPVVKLNAGETFSVAEYVKVSGADLAKLGLSLQYEVVKGKVTVENGVLTAVEDAAATNSIVKIEVVDNGAVVRRAYVNVRVMGDVKYFDVTAKAVMTASRTSFAFDQVDDWAKALKDQPNTTELVKEAINAIVSQDYLSAIIALGGIPGFYTEYKTFEGVGQAREKVDYTAAGYLESQIEKINDLKTVEDLVEYIQYVENLYAVSDLKTEVDATVGYVIDYIVPKEYQDNQIYEWIKTNIFNWNFSSLFSYANDIVVDIPLVGTVNISTWAREKIDAVLSSDSELKKTIQNKLVEVVTKVEDAYNEKVDSDNATAEELAENVAKATALSNAKIAAKVAAEAELAAVNAANVADLNDGMWGTMVKLLNSDYCQTKFEEYGLGEVYTDLVALCPQVENLVKYTAGTYTFPEEYQKVTEDVVYE